MAILTTVLYIAVILLVAILLLIWICRPRSQTTAQGVAALRYLATFEDDPYVRCNDNLAQHFAPALARRWFWLAPVRIIVKYLLHRQLPGTYEQVVARTRLWDMALVKLLTRNHCEGVKDARVQQLVILGAGYDTRAYRFTDLFLENKVRVFEVDREEMQITKMDKLAKVLKGKVPKYVTYVATDFNNTGALPKSLLNAGFDPKKITVWLWEGVTGYLTPEAVDSTVEFMRANSPRMSTLLFDFVRQSAVDSPSTHYGSVQTAARVSSMGESRGGFTIDDKKLGDWLADRGMVSVQHIPPRSLQTFARKSNGAMLGRVTGYLDFCVAQFEGTAEDARREQSLLNASPSTRLVATATDENNRPSVGAAKSKRKNNGAADTSNTSSKSTDTEVATSAPVVPSAVESIPSKKASTPAPAPAVASQSKVDVPNKSMKKGRK